MKQRFRAAATIVFFCSATAFAEELIRVLTLEEAVASAIAAGPDVALIDRELEAARQELRVAESSGGLSLSLDGGYGHSGGIEGMEEPLSLQKGDSATAGLSFGTSSTKASLSGDLAFPGAEPDDPVSSVNLAVKQTLWDGFLPGGKIRAGIERARMEFRVKELEAGARRREAAYRAREAFFQVLYAQRMRAFRLDTLARREAECGRTAAYLASRRASALDMAQAELERDQAARDAETASLRLESSRRTLLRLTALDAPLYFEVADPGIASAPPGDRAAVAERARAGRPEVEEAELLVRMAEIDLRLASAGKSPVVTAEAGMGWNRSLPDGDDYGSFNAGIGVSLPLIDAGRAAATKRAAEERLEASRLKLDQAAKSVSQEAEDALAALEDAAARLELSGRARDQLASRRDFQEARFEQGLASRWDVLEAALALTAGEAAFLAARMELETAAIALDRATGGPAAP